MNEKHTILEDMTNTLNKNGCIELAFADPGGSVFSEAIYCRHLNINLLSSLNESGKNIAFLNGLSPDKLSKKANPKFEFDKLIYRCSSDNTVKQKNVISLDVDFKDFVPNFLELSLCEKKNLVSKTFHDLLPDLKAMIGANSLWLVVYTGGGLHFHFKLANPIDCSDKEVFAKNYSYLIDYLECNLSGEVLFDKACKNTARLMRLPLSFNLKHASEPIETEVCYHNPKADASSFISGIWRQAANYIKTLKPYKEQSNCNPIMDHKSKVKASLTFEKILHHFNYKKFDSIKKKSGDKYWLSSPFSKDPNPSCQIDNAAQIFYDFSTGQGGDVFNMIGLMAELSYKREFGKVMQIAEDITGIKPPEIYRASLTKDDWFEANNNQIFKCFNGPNGVGKNPLSNFFAKITSEDIHDDGQNRSVHLTLEGKLNTGEALPPITIPSEHYSTLNWITHQWGIGPVIYPGYAAKDQLRSAIQLFSLSRVKRQVYTHFGWRKINDKNVFLHAGGAIGNKSTDDVMVDTGQSSLCNYVLPQPPQDNKLKTMVKNSFLFLELLPANIAYPLLGAVFRTPLNEALPIDFTIFMVGKTGTFKSEIAGIVQSFFGDFHAKNLPGNWSSTANSLERLAFLAKDVVFCIDDYAPDGGDTARLQRDAERLIRNQGNKAGRDRMYANGSIRPKNFPRGLVLATGEDIPKGHSIRARMAILETTPGLIEKNNLTKLQQLRDGKVYSSVMSGYLLWLADKIDSLKDTLVEQHKKYRQSASQSSNHLRTPDIAASLFVGVENFFTFAQYVGAITEGEKASFCQFGWDAIGKMAQCQGAYQASEEPVKRVIALITSALISGRVHLSDAKTDGIPSDAGSWGWVDGGYGFQSKGEKIGWINDNELYFDPDLFFVAVNKLARDQGQPLSISKDTLIKQMAIEGLILTTTENNQQRHTLKRTIGASTIRKRLLIVPDKNKLSGCGFGKSKSNAAKTLRVRRITA